MKKLLFTVFTILSIVSCDKYEDISEVQLIETEIEEISSKNKSITGKTTLEGDFLNKEMSFSFQGFELTTTSTNTLYYKSTYTWKLYPDTDDLSGVTYLAGQEFPVGVTVSRVEISTGTSFNPNIKVFYNNGAIWQNRIISGRADSNTLTAVNEEDSKLTSLGYIYSMELKDEQGTYQYRHNNNVTKVYKQTTSYGNLVWKLIPDYTPFPDLYYTASVLATNLPEIENQDLDLDLVKGIFVHDNGLDRLSTYLTDPNKFLIAQDSGYVVKNYIKHDGYQEILFNTSENHNYNNFYPEVQYPDQSGTFFLYFRIPKNKNIAGRIFDNTYGSYGNYVVVMGYVEDDPDYKYVGVYPDFLSNYDVQGDSPDDACWSTSFEEYGENITNGISDYDYTCEDLFIDLSGLHLVNAEDIENYQNYKSPVIQIVDGIRYAFQYILSSTSEIDLPPVTISTINTPNNSNGPVIENVELGGWLQVLHNKIHYRIVLKGDNLPEGLTPTVEIDYFDSDGDEIQSGDVEYNMLYDSYEGNYYYEREWNIGSHTISHIKANVTAFGTVKYSQIYVD